MVQAGTTFPNRHDAFAKQFHMVEFKAALHCVNEQKISVVPIISGTKRPACKWKQYRHRFATYEELKSWFLNTNHGMAAVCGRLSNLTVLDADSPDAEEWIAHNAFTGRILRSQSKGLHYHFDFVEYPNRQNLLNRSIDVRSEGALAMLPPTPGYRWISKGSRGQLNNVLPTIYSTSGTTIKAVGTADQLTRRTLAYLAKLPISISGSGGHGRCYRAACCIADRMAHLIAPEDALPIMQEWNQNCEPPWSTAELLHKLKSAWQR